MRYVIKSPDTKYVIIEKAWRRRWGGRQIPKKVEVHPKTGKPYMAVRWTGRGATADPVRTQLKQLVRELSGEERGWLDQYIRWKYGQVKYKRPIPKPEAEHEPRLREYAKKVDAVMKDLPKHQHVPGQTEHKENVGVVQAGPGGAPEEQQPEIGGTQPRKGYANSTRMAEYLKQRAGKYPTWDSALQRLKWAFPGQDPDRYERALSKAGYKRPGVEQVPGATVPRRMGVDSNVIAEYLRVRKDKYPTWGTALERIKQMFPGQTTDRYERALGKAGYERPPTAVVHGDIPVNDMGRYIERKKDQGLYKTWPTALKRLKEIYPGQPDDKYEEALERAGYRKPKEKLVLDKATMDRIIGLSKEVENKATHQRQYLQEGEVESVEPLGGGATGTYVMKIRGDGQGAWKPRDEEDRSNDLRPGEVPLFSYWKREAASYILAKALDMEDLHPETYVRNDPVRGVGSIQDWEGDGENHQNYKKANRYPADVPRCVLFDYLIESSDRHSGNYFVTSAGKIRLIDHGLSFDTGRKHDSRTQNADFIAGDLHTEIPREVLQKAVDTVDKVTEQFARLGLEKKPIDRYKERIEIIKQRLTTGQKVDVNDLIEDYLSRREK